MASEGSINATIFGSVDKRNIAVTFAVTLSEEFY